MNANKRELKKIGEWLVNGNTGISSLGMAGVMLGGLHITPATPCDPSDLRRCILLLECVDPSRRLALIDRMAQVNPEWGVIKQNWFTLMQLYEQERAERNAPALYSFMKKIGL